MTREEAIQWLKVINTKEFGWDEFALQESQREIRERCEQGVREAIDMAIESLSADEVVRCKDCRFAEHGTTMEMGEIDETPRHYIDWIKCHNYDIHKGVRFVKDDDFCSYAERREP